MERVIIQHRTLSLPPRGREDRQPPPARPAVGEVIYRIKYHAGASPPAGKEAITIADYQYRNLVSVIGHRHPDTDSICSAIAYAWLKNQGSDGTFYEPRRAGDLNRETEFVLRYFGVDTPRICLDVRPQLKDAEYRLAPGIDEDLSLRDAWTMMVRDEIETLCITDEENNFKGIITLKDIGQAYMNIEDTTILAEAHTSYANLAKTLNGELLVGNLEDRIERGKLCIGSNPEMMEDLMEEGDIVLVTNRYETQSYAVESGAGCVIVCCGAKLPKAILHRATEKGCAILATPMDTYSAARLISMAAPVSFRMITKDILKFTPDTPVEEVRKVMAGVRHRYFPVMDASGKYAGVISRRNLLNPHRKKLILVDHNEKLQAVSGLEEAEILEIIDHHRLGALETGEPLVFRNMPVGCTSTILYRIFGEMGVTPSREIAGLMLSAILSDTLMFRSATCTDLDRTAAEALASIAGVDMASYAEQMFRAGEDLTGRSPEEIVNADLKDFRFGDMTVAVGQSLFMTEEVFRQAEELIRPYIPIARKKSGEEMFFYMLTFTPEKRTRLLYDGEGAEELVRRAFGVDTSDGAADLPGVVSRKKQMIPPLRSAVAVEQGL